MREATEQVKNIAIFVSGEGTNLQAIAQAVAREKMPLAISVVICNRPQAAAIEKAKALALPVEVVDHQAYPTREAFEQKLVALMQQYQIEWVVLAGFMRQLTSTFVDAYVGRMINIHPSLLPKYPGLKTHARVLEAQDQEHGITIHFVSQEVDAGPVIAQISMMVSPEDDETSLKKRTQNEEHHLYPLVLSWIAHDRLEWNQGRPKLDGFELPENGIQVPNTTTIDSCITN